MKLNDPHIISKILLSIINSMQQNSEPFVMNPGKDFTRKRDISLSNLILSIITLGSHKMKKELYKFFSPLKKTIPSNSSFSQQRAKLNNDAFPHILSTFNNICPFRKKLKGLHAIAIDGSDLNVPATARDCSTFIPYNSRNGGYHQLHVNAAYDLLEKRYVDIVIQPRGEFNEQAAACDMVDRISLKGKCLFTCDRGYECFNLMAHIQEGKHYFLIRAKDLFSVVSPYRTLTLPDFDEFDENITLIISRSCKREKTGSALYKVIRSDRRFDYIDPTDKESIYKLSFRLVKIRLEDGKFEYLLTNLPRKLFALADMKALYHLRWKIETSFLFLKYGVSLNYFHSVKTERLYQEIYAKIILFNFISLIIQCVPVPEKDTKYNYQISFTDAVYLCIDYLLNRQSWDFIHRELLRHLTPIRPDRKYPRKVVSQRLRPLQHRS